MTERNDVGMALSGVELGTVSFSWGCDSGGRSGVWGGSGGVGVRSCILCYARPDWARGFQCPVSGKRSEALV